MHHKLMHMYKRNNFGNNDEIKVKKLVFVIINHNHHNHNNHNHKSS